MMNNLRTHMRWIMIVIVVTFLLSTFFMYEGRSGRRRSGRSEDGTMADYEVAQVNGRPMMRSELENLLRSYLENYGQRNMASLDMPAIYKTVFDQYVLDQQMAREVQKEGIVVSDADAEAAMKAYADMAFPTREAFYQALEQSGIRIEDYKKNLARQLANEQLLRLAIGDVTVSEDEAVQFYDTMKDMIYRTPEGFNVNLASFNNSADAEALRERLLKGEDWAHATSADKAVSNDVQNITNKPIFLPESAFKSGALSPLDSLDVGKVSPVFSISSSDFAVGLKTERVSESVRPYDDVSEDIRVLLRQQQERRKLSEYEAELLAKADVVIHDPSLFPRPSSEDAAAPAPETSASADVSADVSSDVSADLPTSPDAAK